MSTEAKDDDMADSYERGQVIQIINSVLDKVQKTEGASKDALLQELRELSFIIETSRKDLGAMRTGDIRDKHIPDATDELEAIVNSTAEATGAIMDACEVIQGLFDKMDSEVAQSAEAAVTNIFEACSFQDITGQRITKVVITLERIEKKVEKIMTVMGRAPGIDHDVPPDSLGDEALVNGPQLPGQGVSQDDIDKLLAEFD